MRLYFMRHAHALDPDEWSGEEAARPLTDKGRKRAEAAASGLARLRPGVGAIIASPYARAYETAIIVGRVIGLPVEASDMLAPGFDLVRLDRALAQRSDVDAALLVAHEPDLSRLVGTLTRRAGDDGVTMKKASCALVVTPAEMPTGGSIMELAGRCELAWLRDWRELAAIRET